MLSPRASVRLIGAQLARRLHEIAHDEAAVAAWESGDLSAKLRQVQKKMRAAMRERLGGAKESRSLKFIFNCSRRLGKSFLLLADALEIGLTTANARLPFAASTQKQMKNILLPIYREITTDCPSSVKPVWRAADQVLFFPKTGAEIPIAGCERGNEERLRGTAAHKAYVDEAQSIKNLKYVVQDILMPQLLTTNGSMVIAGTPPKTPIHDFVNMIAEARARGNYMELPIWEAGYDADLVERFMEEAGGRNSTTFRREYLCEIIVDDSAAIVPEWKPTEHERVPERDEYFPFYHKYEAMDIGGRRDKTANLFGWYDFRRSTLFVDNMFSLHGPEMTTARIADETKRMELDIFGAHPLKLRVADNNNEILLQDLGAMHKLHFVPTSKDTLQAMVNQVRLWVAAGRVVVHPRCVELTGCLRYAIWNDTRDGFERFPEDSDAHKAYGHFDALAALVYMVRNVNEKQNPVPPDFKLDRREMFIPPVSKGPDEKVLKRLFTPRFRR